jgi:hypothetical protein
MSGHEYQGYEDANGKNHKKTCFLRQFQSSLSHTNPRQETGSDRQMEIRRSPGGDAKVDSEKR